MFKLSHKIQNTIACLSLAMALTGQTTSNPSDWKTWMIPPGNAHGVPAPPGAAQTQEEMDWLRAATQQLDPRMLEQIRYWDAGPPAYRWMDLLTNRQIHTSAPIGLTVRAYAYVSIAIYDATIAAAKAKDTYRPARPSQLDPSLPARVNIPRSSSYPSDYAATAAAAAEVLAYLIPAEAAHYRQLAEEAGRSRLYAGVELPSDYLAGLDLGRRVAAQVIEKAKLDGSDVPWTGSVPTGRCLWTGTNPGNAAAANWKPLLLTSPAEFRPAPPPSCDSPEVAAQLAEVKAYPRALTGPNMSTNAKAFYWQTPEGVFPWAFVHLNRWILEDQMENDAARAARAYALLGAVGLDAFIASQDAKFAYWYLRPAQLDSSLTTLFPAPNFPSYPSNHSTFSTARAEVLAYLFPNRADAIRALGKEAGDSRIWAGIHYEMDNQAGVQLGHKIAQKFISWAQSDGAAQ